MKNKLWTRDFTIITIGTVISMLGSSVSGFAIGIMVLDYTNSVFLYSLYMGLYILPKIFMPLVSGPFLDKFSRKRTIYTLDFISAGLFVIIWAILRFGSFNYLLFVLLAMIIGAIDAVYEVAYDSFYPNLITEGNMSRAYSISSMIYPLSALMVPVAAWIYERFGISPLFLFNAVSFLIAAISETMIKAEEKYTENNGFSSFAQFRADFREGIKYLRDEKGLRTITFYFFFNAITSGIAMTLMLPYFKSVPSLGVQTYTYVMGAGVIGRLAGGAFHYAKKIRADRKFLIAISVYTACSLIEGVQLFLPVAVMMALNFIDGMLGVTSFNIRISATQAYVCDEKRARFNSVFLMVTNIGGIAGQLAAGVLGEYLPIRLVVAGVMAVNMGAVCFIMYRNRKDVKLIYNREL